MSLTAGVVAVQGNTRAHEAAFQDLGTTIDRDIEVIGVRREGILPNCDMIALPGGESTTISKLVHTQGLADELREHVAANKPLLATCAGLIVVASEPADERVTSLDLLDVSVERNAFGRQRDSFEAELDVDGLADPFPGVFIRAPIVGDPGEASVLATLDDHVVAVRSGPIVGTSFHPELSGDSRIHRLAFADVV